MGILRRGYRNAHLRKDINEPVAYASRRPICTGQFTMYLSFKG